MEHGGKLYYYLYNLQGDVIALCDASSKQIVAKYSYDAWGKLLTKENLGTGTIADVNPFRYRGYYYDSETGMYYLNARYYDPETGRFLNADALLGANVGAPYNLYSYCGNCPVNKADPSGNAVALAAACVFLKAALVTLAVLTVCLVLSHPTVQRSIQKAAERTAKAVKSAVENQKKKLTTKNHSVYVMRNKDTREVEYVGRTVNPVRRQNEHRRDPNKAHLDKLEVKFTNLTLPEARAVEQTLISAYTLKNLDNARREIAAGNVAGFQENMGRVVQIFQNSTEDELLNLMGR